VLLDVALGLFYVVMVMVAVVLGAVLRRHRRHQRHQQHHHHHHQ
jgi:hypothetical protein